MISEFDDASNEQIYNVIFGVWLDDAVEKRMIHFKFHRKRCKSPYLVYWNWSIHLCYKIVHYRFGTPRNVSRSFAASYARLLYVQTASIMIDNDNEMLCEMDLCYLGIKCDYYFVINSMKLIYFRYMTWKIFERYENEKIQIISQLMILTLNKRRTKLCRNIGILHIIVCIY